MESVTVTFLNKDKRYCCFCRCCFNFKVYKAYNLSLFLFFRKFVLEVNRVDSHLHSQEELDMNSSDFTQCGLSLQISGSVSNSNQSAFGWSHLKHVVCNYCNCIFYIWFSPSSIPGATARSTQSHKIFEWTRLRITSKVLIENEDMHSRKRPPEIMILLHWFQSCGRLVQ